MEVQIYFWRATGHPQVKLADSHQNILPYKGVTK